MERLISILNQELKTYNRFLNLLDDQHKMIISRDLEGLSETDYELDFQNAKLYDLEKERREIVDDISKRLKLDKNNIKLRDLLPRLDSVSSNRLHLLREAIMGAHGKIEEKRMRNKLLIESSRELISETLKIISRRPSPVYNKPGPGKSEVFESNLVNRSV